jgi:hypothetical protein
MHNLFMDIVTSLDADRRGEVGLEHGEGISIDEPAGGEHGKRESEGGDEDGGVEPEGFEEKS